MSVYQTLLDETFRSAWWRFVQLWRPMAGWTLLVWALVGLILGPLSSAVLARIVLRGDRIILGNEDLIVWLLRPEGLAYVTVAVGLTVMGAVIRYAGLFRILTDDLRSMPISVRLTLFELLPDLPALFRLCLTAAACAILLLLPLAGGIVGIYFVLLGEHDINFYLTAEPPEWRQALIAAGAWGAVWATGTVYLVLRSLPALPAFLDGHRPFRVALIRGWSRTRGSAVRVLWLLLLCLGTWFLLRTLAQAGFFFLAATAMEQLAGTFDSVTPILLASAVYALGSIVLDASISFFGFSFSSIVLTKFYYEDTDLHYVASPVPLGLGRLPRKVANFLRTWFHPRRALPIFVGMLLFSGTLSGWLLRELPAEPAFIVTAHRAGALLATENTLAALERSIEAGADYAEIDVQSTRDGEVVVFHDADLMRLAGDPRRIRDTDFADLDGIVLGRDPEIPPHERQLATLDEFLERALGRIRLNIELKYYGSDPDLAERVLEQIFARNMEEEVVITSLDLSALRQVQRLAPQIPTGFVAAVSVGDLARLPVQLLAVSRSLATDRHIRTAHQRGIEVHVWTLNDASEILVAVERGADGIITDDPFLAVSLRNELAGLTVPERLLVRFGRLLTGTESSAGPN